MQGQHFLKSPGEPICTQLSEAQWLQESRVVGDGPLDLSHLPMDGGGGAGRNYMDNRALHEYDHTSCTETMQPRAAARQQSKAPTQHESTSFTALGQRLYHENQLPGP